MEVLCSFFILLTRTSCLCYSALVVIVSWWSQHDVFCVPTEGLIALMFCSRAPLRETKVFSFTSLDLSSYLLTDLRFETSVTEIEWFSVSSIESSSIENCSHQALWIIQSNQDTVSGKTHCYWIYNCHFSMLWELTAEAGIKPGQIKPKLSACLDAPKAGWENLDL